MIQPENIEELEVALYLELVNYAMKHETTDAEVVELLMRILRDFIEARSD